MNKFDHFFMGVAESAARLSYAQRLKVGSVAVQDGNILAFGYNGTLPGLDNTCEDKVWVSDVGPWGDAGEYKLVTRDNVLHSEENLLIKLAKSTASVNGATIYITHMPCMKCSRMIAAAGFRRLVYKEEYRDVSGVELLKSYGVTVEKFNG